MEGIILLEGMELLSVKDVSIPLLAGILTEIICLAIVVCSIYLLIMSFKKRDVIVVLFSLLFIGSGVFLSSLIVDEVTNSNFIYKVAVSDSVSLNEFYENYEILEVDGKIYTIKEKEG